MQAGYTFGIETFQIESDSFLLSRLTEYLEAIEPKHVITHLTDYEDPHHFGHVHPQNADV